MRWRRFDVVAFCPGCGTYSQPLKSVVWRTALRDLQVMLRGEQEQLLTRHPLTQRQYDLLTAFADQHAPTVEFYRGNDYSHPSVQIELHVTRAV